MRTTEKTAGILIVALTLWAIVMMATTNLQFQGGQSNRILRVELGSDAASLNQAVQATGTSDANGVSRNIELVILNTRLDFVFIFFYLLTFISLAYLAGLFGNRFLASCSAICICTAALCDVLENRAILSAMHVHPFTDQLAVDITMFSEWKWVFFFLAALFLGLAIALNHRISPLRRLSGGIFIAASLFGILGVSRHRVSLDFTFWMISIGTLLVTAALLVTLWKIYQSLKELNHFHDVQQVRAHA